MDVCWLSGEQTQFLAELVTQQTQRIFRQQWSAHLDRLAEAQAIMPRLFGIGAADDFRRYSRDAFQRSVLFSDTFAPARQRLPRARGAGDQPVLAFDYDIVADGRNSSAPSTTRCCASPRPRA